MPSRKRRTPFLVWIIGALALLALAAALVGLAGVDYRLALALLAGALAAWLLMRVLRALVGWLRRRRRPWVWVALLALGGLAAVIVIGGGLLLTLAPTADSDEPAPAEAEAEPQAVTRSLAISGYRVTVRASDSPAAGVLVTEELFYAVSEGEQIVFPDLALAPPERRVESVQRGFLLKEVRIEPLGGDAHRLISLPLPDGTQMSAWLCRGLACQEAVVQLEDFPAGSFYAARGVTEVEIVPYANTEIISWRTRDLSDGVVFAYIPPPFQALRPLLAPLVGASRADEWLVALVGMLATVASGPFVKPVLESLVEDRIKDLLRGRKSTRRSGKSSRRR